MLRFLLRVLLAFVIPASLAAQSAKQAGVSLLRPQENAVDSTHEVFTPSSIVLSGLVVGGLVGSLLQPPENAVDSTNAPLEGASALAAAFGTLGLVEYGKLMSTGAVVAYSTVIGGLVGHAVARGLGGTSGDNGTAPATSTIVTDAALGAIIGGVTGFALKKMLGSSNFKSAPSIIRTLTHVEMIPSTRSVRFGVAW